MGTYAMLEDQPTIVLVDSAFTDLAFWNKVVVLLQGKGLTVVTVNNPRTSLSDDVTVTTRLIKKLRGPVILVGHSSGGILITQAGMSSQVVALIYIAAVAPDVGESTFSAQMAFPRPAWRSYVVTDPAGFFRLREDAYSHYFAHDLPPEYGRLLAASQCPMHEKMLEEKVTQVAWRRKPSWYLITEDDRIIDPELQRFQARRMNATIGSIRASHVAARSRPRETTNFIAQIAADPWLPVTEVIDA